MARSSVTARIEAVKSMRTQQELIAALSDSSNLVVEAAADRLAVPAAAGPLADAYRRLEAGAPKADPGCRGRLAILRTLGRLEAEEGADLALWAIHTVQIETVGFGREDTAVSLRSMAAGVLAHLRPPGTLLELALLLNDIAPNAGGDVYEKMGPRITAARALGTSGDLAAGALLAVKLQYPAGEVPEVLSECIDGLVALREPAGPRLIRPYLAHRDPYLVATAATGLATLMQKDAVPVLEEALPSVVPEARASLVYAIASIRDEAARSALQRLAEHPDPQVQAAAREQI